MIQVKTISSHGGNYSRSINETLETLQEEGSTILDVKHSIAREGVHVTYSALILYDDNGKE